jgi:putative sterol carrier protein
MAKFLSDKWLKDCVKTLQNSEEFRDNAGTFKGDFVFVFEADDGLAKTKRLYLSINRGDCREAFFLNGEPVPNADYRISAPYSLWTKIITGEQDPLNALRSRDVKVKGNMLRIMMNLGTATALVRTLSAVPIEFN